MKFGVNTLLWTAAFDQSNLALLDRIKAWGFDGVEIARFSFDGFPAREIGRAVREAGLECTLCTALTGRVSLVAEDNAAAHDFLGRAIEAAAELGAGWLVGPVCAPVGYLPGRRRTEDEWQRAIEGLASLGDTLLQHDVTLAVEPLNRFETYFLNTTADAAALCFEVHHPRIGLLYDTFHSNIEDKSVARAMEVAAPYLQHVHACENDRGTPGTGHIDWDALFASLRDYQGWVVIESFGFGIPEIAAATCIWRDLANSADEIASEGIRFLKRRANEDEPSGRQ